MTLEATLDLLHEIVASHRNRPTESASVVYSVHDNADSADDADLFASVARLAGGTYVRCHPDVEDISFRGPLNQSMATQAAQLAAQRGIDLTIEEVDGLIISKVQGSSDLSDSATILSQVVSLLCSAEIESDLFIFSYPSTELDESRASLLWELAGAVPLLRPAAVKTLAPIILGWVDVARHCNPPIGAVRYVVRGDELIRRQARREPDTRLNSILMSTDEPIVLFLGAGASASARIPQGNAIRDAAIAHLTGTLASSDELLPSFRHYLDDRPQRFLVGEQQMSEDQFENGLTLERVLREEFHELSGRDRADSHTVRALTKHCTDALQWNPPGRRAVRDLARLLPKLVLATVNFDQLIEQDLGADHTVFASADEFRSARSVLTDRMSGSTTPVPVLKFHGTIERPDTLVADIETTTVGLPSELAESLDALVSTARRITWVWIGCSMRDVDIQQWLRRQSATNIVEFWVDPLPPRSVREYAQSRASEWASTSQTLADRQITESSDVFLPALLKRAQELNAAATGR